MTAPLSRHLLAAMAVASPALFIGRANAQTTTTSAFDRVTRTKVLRADIPRDLSF